jgi:hypothetical protein
MHCIFVIGSGYIVVQEEPIRSFWGVNICEAQEN